MLTPRRINREALITSQKQLVDYLAAGARPEAEWGIGAEMEKLVLDAQTGAAAEFSRIEALLNTLASKVNAACQGQFRQALVTGIFESNLCLLLFDPGTL